MEINVYYVGSEGPKLRTSLCVNANMIAQGDRRYDFMLGVLSKNLGAGFRL